MTKSAQVTKRLISTFPLQFLFIIYALLLQFLPDISLKDNLDKIIIGNVDNSKIALVVNNKNVEKYLEEENIKFAKVIDSCDEISSKNITYINGGSNEDDFTDIKYCLKKSDLNKNICDVDTSHYASCINNKSYIVKSSGVIKSNNISKEINNINGGTIVKINPNLTLNEFKVYLSKIKYNNLEIIDLLDLIKE